MILKKIISVLLLLMLTSIVAPAFAAGPVAGAATENANDLRVQQVYNRIVEIRGMDRSSLTSSEKRELRKELRSLKKETQQKRKNGLYISLGAIVIIALLLILLL